MKAKLALLLALGALLFLGAGCGRDRTPEAREAFDTAFIRTKVQPDAGQAGTGDGRPQSSPSHGNATASPAASASADSRACTAPSQSEEGGPEKDNASGGESRVEEPGNGGGRPVNGPPNAASEAAAAVPSAAMLPGNPQQARGSEPSRGKTAPMKVSAYYASDYQGDSASYDSFVANSAHIDQIVAFSHKVDSQGSIGGTAESRLFKAAKKTATPVLALLHNCENGVFQEWVAADLLGDPEARERLAKNAASLTKSGGYSGVNLDIENVATSRRSQYVDLASKMSKAVRGAGGTFTISIPAKTGDDPGNAWSGAFDYAKLGSIADQVMLMTYDQHYPHGSAGPVASIRWVEEVIEYAKSVMPSTRIYLGIATYGYDWPPGGGQAAYVSAKEAARAAASRQAEIRWDDDAQVPYFQYRDASGKRTVYFENGHSAAFKLDLALRHRLGGIAIWRLGQEDPVLWDAISQKLGQEDR